MAKSAYEKPAEEWTEKEIEVEKLRLEAHRAKSEGSIGRRYGTIILSGVFAITGSVLAYYSNNAADTRASQAAREETERNLAQNAVRVYFENPDRFDLKTDEGKFNLRVLADTAPGKTTATLISQIQDNAVQMAATNSEIAVASPAVAAAATPTAAAPAADASTMSRSASAPAGLAAAPATNVIEARQVTEAARYQEIAKTTLTTVQNASKPGDFKVFVQFGTGAQGQASQTQKRLMDLGYNAPPVTITTTPTDRPEVRYYLAGQAKAAEQLAMQLKDVIGGAPSIKYIGETYKGLPDGIMEVWLPPQGATSEQAFQQGYRIRKTWTDNKMQSQIQEQANKAAPILRRSLPSAN